MEAPERHPYWQWLWERGAAQPDAVEDHPWGETVFKVRGKIFTFLSPPDRAALTVKADPDELEALLSMPFVERAPYVGRYGWIRVTVEDEEGLALALELIETSYGLIRKPKKRKPA